MRTGSHAGDREVALDGDIALIRRRFAVSFPQDAVVGAALYGLEVLKPGGWRPVVHMLSRRVRTYRSKADAVEACFQHWARFGMAVRPFPLD
jgi:hypothetical protein